MMKVPFGRYRGKSVESLPTGYLMWLADGVAREPLLTDEVRFVASEIVAAGFRQLAQRRHPDHGGSHQAMLALNEARNWLMEVTG